MIISARFRIALAALVAVTCMALPACGFQDTRAVDAEDPAEMLENFRHYAMIANVELAAAYAQKIFDSGITNAQLAELLDEGKMTREQFDRAIDRAQMVPELEAVAADLARRVEAGRLDLARDPKRIAEAIQMLGGVQRAKLLAKQRLIAAGEFAVPELLRQITDGHDEQLKLASQEILIQIGRPAVTPLCVAMLQLTGVSQRSVCDILGTIHHPHAAPYLRELSLNQAADGQAREAALRAFNNLEVADAPLTVLYSNLARQYFDGHEALIAYPFDDLNTVWTFNDFTGLSPMPVPTPIFTEVMAVQTATRAIQIDKANSAALSLFVAANLKRENDLPEGAADPIYGESKYSPDFYATVFGTQTCLDVLGLAIDKLDTPLVRDAITALAKTTGGANLFARGTGRQPLLEAMTYPDRRVQYESALTLGRALPQQKFTGDDAVVPLLASAVRMGNKSLAVVISSQDENRQQEAARAEQLGFEIVATGASVNEARNDVNRAVGVDLVIVRAGSADEARDVVDAVRQVPKMRAAPIMIVAGAADEPALRNEYRDDYRVNWGRPRIATDAYTAAVESLMKRASGGRITEAEAEEYAIRSLGVLRDVAISRSPAYTIKDAENALIDALETRSGGTRMLVADILALIDSDPAQRKLFDAALAAKEDEQVELLMRVADSVRIWGDHAEQRHVSALVNLVANSTGPTAEAAATVHGALNLPTSEAVDLLP